MSGVGVARLIEQDESVISVSAHLATAYLGHAAGNVRVFTEEFWSLGAIL
jgi:hypothetical protein